MDRQEEDIIINYIELRAWINKEINYIQREQIPKTQRYQKVRHEGYLAALKKIRTKMT